MKECELVAGHSIGGVGLGDSQADVIRVLGQPLTTREKGASVFLEYDGLTVLLLDGSVFNLIAETPSCGRTKTGIRVGTSWMDLKRLSDDVEFDEEEGSWFSPSEPGVWYQVVRPAHDFEEPLDPPYVPEMYLVSDEDGAFVRRMFVMRGVGSAWQPGSPTQ